MRSTSRALTVILTAAVPLLLVTGCSGDGNAESPSNDLTPITGSSYVTILPATTTTTTTVAPTDPGQLEPGQTAPGQQEYTVQAGDSVSRIASLHGITGDVLASYNQWADGIQHPIFPGDVVLIPPDSLVPGTGGATTVPPTGETAGETETTVAPTDGECPTTYVIQEGDTSRIRVAESFGITFEQMDAANANTPGYQNFIVGTPITIPCP